MEKKSAPTKEEQMLIASVEKKNAEEIKRLKNVHIIKTLARYMKGYWKHVYLAWLCVAIEVVGEVMIPFVAQYAVNIIDPASGMMSESDVPNLIMYCSIMAALAIVSCVGGVFAGFFAAIASSGFGKKLRQAMYYNIQTFSFSNIDRFSTASLVTRLTTDCTNVTNSIQAIVRTVVRAPFMMIFAVVMAAITSWQLSLIFLVAIPVLGFALIFIAAKVHPTFVKVFNAYDDLNASVQENLSGIRVVKSFGREQFEDEKFGRVSYFIYRTFLHAERILAVNSPLMQLTVYACMLIISFFGAKMIIANGNVPDAFNTGSLTSLFTYVMQILMSLNMVSMVFVMIIIARNSAERISEVIIEKPDIVSKPDAIKEVQDGSVDFNHVHFRYSASGSKDVLNDIDLHIPSGSTVGIIGATGSSKSTLVSLIARLYDVTEGSVKVGGIDVRDYDLPTLRDAVAVVLQKNTLFTGTIASNLRWGKEDATLEEMKHACHLACADEFIEKLPLKYDSPIDEGGTNVSGGQKQRLCIARALLKSPKILILDDSTSAVDTHTDSVIREAFRTEIPDVTKFIIAQRVLSIKDCDIILVMDDGKIIAKGTNDELMQSSPVYKEIYETQLGGGDFDEQ